jgi:hypothetical protein
MKHKDETRSVFFWEIVIDLWHEMNCLQHDELQLLEAFLFSPQKIAAG